MHRSDSSRMGSLSLSDPSRYSNTALLHQRLIVDIRGATVIGIFIDVVIKYPVVTVVVAGKVESTLILFTVILFTGLPDF